MTTTKKSKPPTTTSVAIDQIMIDEGLQPRVEINTRIVTEYAQVYRDFGPEGLPPIRVMRYTNSKDLVLTRGFTRLAAAKQAELTEIPAEVHVAATEIDMLLDSLGGNKHGQRLTTADKRRSMDLYHQRVPESGWGTTREVAQLIGCSHDSVARYRKDLSESDSDDDETEPQADAGARERYLIELARPKVAQLTGLTMPHAILVSLAIGLESSGPQIFEEYDLTKVREMNALFSSTALSQLQEVVTDPSGGVRFLRDVVWVLSHLADQLGLDWPALVQDADLRFASEAVA